MNILKNLTHLSTRKNQIVYSSIKNIFTKYGSYKAQTYMVDTQEYVVFMSQDFFDLENPIVYIDFQTHACNVMEQESCGCGYQMPIILKTIHKEGGAVIYTSHKNSDIDTLLHEIKARKLKTKAQKANITKATLGVTQKSEYEALGFILKNLQLSTMQLITSDFNIITLAGKLQIEITLWSPSLSFGYDTTA